MRKLEILAPAGNMEILKSVILAGCDAVYLGMSDFNARNKAENFNKETIKEAVRFAHLYGVKVYVTFNTLIKDEEMERLLESVKTCVDAKVDAYLIQDMGVAKLLLEKFKGITLHASTQLGCNNVYSAKALEEFGFKRVVLARETRLEDIIRIKKETNLEIEYFVQGALCVSYSGNCLISSKLYGDSGNRGRCRQLCRFKYRNNITNEEAYYLSARDQSLVTEIKALIDAGVISFKIEGRLRHKGYAIGSVREYRRIIDSINENLNINEIDLRLKESFSRGEFLKKSYLYGTPDNVINSLTNNHTGIEIGKIRSVKPFKNIFEILIESKVELNPGDGLKFYDRGVEVSSIGIGNVTPIGNNLYKIYSTKRLKPYLTVNRILNKKTEDEYESFIKRLPVDVKIDALSGHVLSGSISCDGINVTKVTDFNLSISKNNPISDSEVLNQFNRFEDTPFFIENISIDRDDTFIPKGVINALRRELVTSLTEEIIKKNEEEILVTYSDLSYKPNYNFKPKTTLRSIITDNVHDLKGFFKEDLIIYAFKTLDVNQINESLNYLRNNGYKRIGVLEPLIKTSYDLDIIESILKNDKDIYLFANNIDGLYFSKKYKTIGNYTMNVFNVKSYETYLSLGMENMVSSMETEKLYSITKNEIYSYSLGYVALMNFAHCPYKTVKGGTCEKCVYSKNIEYSRMKIRRTKLKYCMFELLSSLPINVLNEKRGVPLLDLRDLDLSLKELEYLNNHQYRNVYLEADKSFSKEEIK